VERSSRLQVCSTCGLGVCAAETLGAGGTDHIQLIPIDKAEERREKNLAAVLKVIHGLHG
jgi:hypothetical protein